MRSAILVIDFELAVIELGSVIGNINNGLDDSVDDLLTFIDEAQAKLYTQNADPSKPVNSRYVRTFDLQNSTEKVHVLKNEGEWIADIDYAQYVLGSRVQQAPIHQGRWKSTEDVIKETENEASSIINAAIARNM